MLKPSQVVTFSASNGDKLALCDHHNDGRTRYSRGFALATVSHGRHLGTCGECLKAFQATSGVTDADLRAAGWQVDVASEGRVALSICAHLLGFDQPHRLHGSVWLSRSLAIAALQDEGLI